MALARQYFLCVVLAIPTCHFFPAPEYQRRRTVSPIHVSMRRSVAGRGSRKIRGCLGNGRQRCRTTERKPKDWMRAPMFRRRRRAGRSWPDTRMDGRRWVMCTLCFIGAPHTDDLDFRHGIVCVEREKSLRGRGQPESSRVDQPHAIG